MNSDFNIETNDFEGVKVITPFIREDNRGYFLKSYEKSIYEKFNLLGDLFETFESYSRKNVIRGLHFQTLNPQTKIVRVPYGCVNDIIVDLRINSKTFGKWKSIKLSSDNNNILWIPAGFAHGFEVLSDEAFMSYYCINEYSPGTDSGILWNDKTLDIKWQTKNPIISQRDLELQSFQDYLKKSLSKVEYGQE